MADGRMLKKEIADSEKIGLCSDKARVLYFMMLPHLDVKGRLSANPKIIKGQYTTMLNYSTKTIQRCLEELHNVRGKEANTEGLIVLYEADGKQYLQYTRFEDFQSLNPDREAKTKIPAPTPANSRELQRTPLKLSKVKLSKDKYGEFVFLSKDEHQKLIEKFGVAGTEQRIKDLNYGIGSKGYSYKSHYYTILSWDRKNSKADKTETKQCVVDRKLGIKFQLACSGEKVWLCDDCLKLLIASEWLGSWADLKKSDLERVLERGKKKLLAQSKPKPKDKELVQADKQQVAVQKLVKETEDNFGKG